MQRFKNILLVTGAKTESAAALERAVTLAKRNQAQLRVVEVLKELPHDVHLQMRSKRPTELQNQIIEQRSSHLEQLILPIRLEEVEVSAQVLCGTPFLEIIREVLRNQHDLVMMTARGKGELREMLFGSTTLHLMRKCPCPVWVMKRTQRKQYARILAAVDFDSFDEGRNPLSTKIMDLATSLAHLERSELHIIHAWALYGESTLRRRCVRTSRREVDKLVRETRSAHRSWLGKLLQNYDLGDMKHQVHLLKGGAGKLIPQLAKRKRVELLVMGTVCRTGVPGFLIGNTAEKVLQQIDCSVLTVKPDGFATPIRLDINGPDFLRH
jgi:nucleotide-binding universal stress UspA family protein